MTTRSLRTPDTFTRAFWVAVLCAWVLALYGCATHQRGTPRPKYGDSTRPVGPDKSLYRSQPKFQP